MHKASFNNQIDELAVRRCVSRVRLLAGFLNYSVWGGANDLSTIKTPAQAPAVIGASVADMVGIVATLQNAGARYIVVPTQPDIGLTPLFRQQGSAAMADGTELASTYNDALFSGIASTGLKVIPVDTFHLLQEIVSNPSTYGFANVTGTACNPATAPSSLMCGPQDYVTPDAAQTFVFADAVHPSAATHAILAQYTLSVLEAPRLQQVLTRSAQTIGRSRVDQVSSHRSGPAADGLSWWGGARGDVQRENAAAYDGGPHRVCSVWIGPVAGRCWAALPALVG